MADLLGQLLRMMRELDNRPPAPYKIVARFDIPPWGRYRMWDTNGRLIVFINRAVIANLKTIPRDQALQAGSIGYLGIPVEFEDV